MELRCVWEHNGDDTLLYLADLTGAFTRGATLSEAACKLERRQDGGGVPVFHCAPPCPSRSAARRAQQSVSEHTNMRFP